MSKRDHQSTSNDSHEDSYENNCPICLNAPSDELAFVQGPCEHPLCQPCMERLLLITTNNSHYVNEEDLHLQAPSLGRCPICRSELSLFELVNSSNTNRVYALNSDVTNWPVAGLTYIEKDKSVGDFSLHFDPDKPYILKGDEQFFFDEYYFHFKSRTFHANMMVPDEWLKRQVVVQFSSDLRYITSGVHFIRFLPPTDEESTREERQKTFPLDGKWLVTWERTNFSDHLEVRAGIFKYGPFQYIVNLENPMKPEFTWPLLSSTNPGTNTRQWAVSGVDLVTEPLGPAVGDKIVWATTDNEKITWTRESVGDVYSQKPIDVTRIGPGYKTYVRHNTEPRERPTYVKETLWGNTFCQGQGDRGHFRVGYASYHFVSEQEGAYISYEHVNCGMWPPLDDGSPVPSRVPFRNVSFNETGRVFRGTIEWQEDYQTTWQGNKRWIYEIKFDSQFMCIISGNVKSVTEDTVRHMSSYGDTLVYINAALDVRFQVLLGLASEQEDGDIIAYDDLNQRYLEVKGEHIRQRLPDEGASIKTLLAVHRILAMPEAGLIDPNL